MGFKTAIVGQTYHSKGEQILLKGLPKGTEVCLLKASSNSDVNAIAVYVQSDPSEDDFDVRVGWVPKDDAADLCALINGNRHPFWAILLDDGDSKWPRIQVTQGPKTP